jgi:hypothetical protein
MAEREGFEPPIALRLCLISSQVHSTGLCHLSVFCFVALTRWSWCPPIAWWSCSRFSPVADLVTIPRRSTAEAWCSGARCAYRMTIWTCHVRAVLQRSADPPGHDKSTGKRVEVAMPGIFLNLGLFEGSREPGRSSAGARSLRESRPLRHPHHVAPRSAKPVPTSCSLPTQCRSAGRLQCLREPFRLLISIRELMFDDLAGLHIKNRNLPAMTEITPYNLQSS